MKNPKIILFDIETAPSQGFYFDKWREGNIVQTTSDWYILSFAWKQLGEKKVNVIALPDFNRYNNDKSDDKYVVKELWNLFDMADILIAHHGDLFDIKKSNARFLKHGLMPPSPYTTIDTRKLARKYFQFDSNKLNDLGQYLGVGRKLKHTGFDLWKDCMDGDLKAWKLMKEYNKQDVILLERIYLKMRGWNTNHPNYNVYKETRSNCPNCGGSNVQSRGFSVTRIGRYKRLHCQDCGAWSKGEKIQMEKLIK